MKINKKRIHEIILKINKDKYYTYDKRVIKVKIDSDIKDVLYKFYNHTEICKILTKSKLNKLMIQVERE